MEEVSKWIDDSGIYGCSESLDSNDWLRTGNQKYRTLSPIIYLFRTSLILTITHLIIAAFSCCNLFKTKNVENKRKTENGYTPDKRKMILRVPLKNIKHVFEISRENNTRYSLQAVQFLWLTFCSSVYRENLHQQEVWLTDYFQGIWKPKSNLSTLYRAFTDKQLLKVNQWLLLDCLQVIPLSLACSFAEVSYFFVLIQLFDFRSN